MRPFNRKRNHIPFFVVYELTSDHEAFWDTFENSFCPCINNIIFVIFVLCFARLHRQQQQRHQVQMRAHKLRHNITESRERSLATFWDEIIED